MMSDPEVPDRRLVALGFIAAFAVLGAVLAGVLYKATRPPPPAVAKPSPPPPPRPAFRREVDNVPRQPVIRYRFQAPGDRHGYGVDDVELPLVLDLWRKALESASLAPLKSGGILVTQMRPWPLVSDVLSPGRVIHEVNGRAIRTKEELFDALRGVPDVGVVIVLERDGRKFRVEYRPWSKAPRLVAKDPRESPMSEAIRENAVDRLRELIEWGVSVHEAGVRSPTRPLRLAVEQGRPEIARLFLEKGAILSLNNPQLEPPLLLLALRQKEIHPDLVRVLLDHGADPNERDPDEDRPALVMAASKNVPAAVSALVDAGAQVDAMDRSGQTALLLAAARRDTETVRFLLSKGADPNLKTPLIHAVRADRGDPGTIRLLLERGADPDARVPSLGTALMCAAGRGDLDVLGLLLDKGADPAVRMRSSPRATTLYAAAANGRKEAVEFLLRRKIPVEAWVVAQAARYGHADVVKLLAAKLPAAEAERALSTALAAAIDERKDEAAAALRELGAKDLRGTPTGLERELFAALKGGDLRAVERLLEQGPDLQARDGEGKTPLLWAVDGYPLALVRSMLDKGGRVEEADRRGLTAVWIAAERGDAGSLKLLLDRGADPRGRAWGATLLERIEDHGFPHIEYLLREKGVTAERSDGAPPSKVYTSEAQARIDQELISAVYRKDVGLVAEALDRKADPNVRGRSFFPVLYAAVRSGREEVVHVLLAGGADVNGRADGEGNTALHAAVQRGPAMLRLLLGAGADVDAPNSDGTTPLMDVVPSPSEEAAPAMIARSRRVNAKNKYGRTALRAVLARPDCVALLLEKGADPDTRDNAGKTVLMEAAERGWMEVAALLLDKGARRDLLEERGRGWTALHYAAHAGQLEMVKLLIERGAGVLQRGSRGETALGVALTAGRTEVAAFLKGAEARK